MIEQEKIQIFSHEEAVKNAIDQTQRVIDSLLTGKQNEVGEGRTASVHFLGTNDEVCLKVYKDKNEINSSIFYLSPEEEKKLLDEVFRLKTKVRVPEVYAAYFADENERGFIMMEHLAAITIDDVLQGRADLPPTFNFERFGRLLMDFLSDIHGAGIHHRDLHEGNIMIDKLTGEPYVIDFGAGTRFWGEPEPGEPGPYDIYQNGQRIKLTSDEAKVKAVLKDLQAYLTKVN